MNNFLFLQLQEAPCEKWLQWAQSLRGEIILKMLTTDIGHAYPLAPGTIYLGGAKNTNTKSIACICLVWTKYLLKIHRFNNIELASMQCHGCFQFFRLFRYSPLR